MSERWLPVVGYEGSYEVSDLGRVRSLDRMRPGPRGKLQRLAGRVMSLWVDDRGYLAVALSRDNKKKQVRVHGLVTAAFMGPLPDGLEVCHNNGDKTDSRLTNLRWDTHQANMQDAVRHGSHHVANKTHCIQGHEFTPENTAIITRPDGGSYRRCIECSRKSSREYHRRLAAERRAARQGSAA